MSPRTLSGSRDGDPPTHVPDIYENADRARRHLGRFLLLWPFYVALGTAAALAVGFWLTSLVPGH